MINCEKVNESSLHIYDWFSGQTFFENSAFLQSWKLLAVLVVLLVSRMVVYVVVMVMVGVVEKAVETMEDAVGQDVQLCHPQILLLCSSLDLVWQRAQISFERVLCKRNISGEFELGGDFLKYQCNHISLIFESWEVHPFAV